MMATTTVLGPLWTSIWVSCGVCMCVRTCVCVRLCLSVFVCGGGGGVRLCDGGAVVFGLGDSLYDGNYNRAGALVD